MSSTRRDEFSLASETSASLTSRRNACTTRDQVKRKQLEAMRSSRSDYRGDVALYARHISEQTSKMASAIGRVGIMAADQKRETADEDIEAARVSTNKYFDSMLDLRRGGAESEKEVSRLTDSIEETKGSLRAMKREIAAIERELEHLGLPMAASCAPTASSSRR